MLTPEGLYGIKSAEGLLDDTSFEIKGIEGIGGRNIIDKISEASRKGAKTVVLYYHDAGMFEEQRIVNAYNGYLKLSKNRNIQKIYYIINEQLHIVDTKKCRR
ncbi:hypothetical protein FACS189467_1690 [Bacteroidia bacterium]|nr:hypothetical protein FACS189467_1690 [Bacteroidia bacterium]